MNKNLILSSYMNTYKWDTSFYLCSVSLSSLTGKMSSASMPDSMKQQLLVKSRMEDPEVQKQRQEIVNTKSVAELGEIHGLSDFPVPATLERLVDKSKRKPVAETEM